MLEKFYDYSFEIIKPFIWKSSSDFSKLVETQQTRHEIDAHRPTSDYSPNQSFCQNPKWRGNIWNHGS